MNTRHTRRTPRRWITPTLALLGVALATPLLAAKKVEQTRAAAPDATIEIECLSGTLSIQAWDRNEVEIRGTVGDDAELEISGSESDIDVEVDVPGRRGGRGLDLDAELTIRVPAGARLEIETLSATVEVVGVRGAHELTTMSGDISVQADGAPVEIETVSGKVEITGAGSTVEVATVSGSVGITGSVSVIRVESVSGDVEVETTEIERGGFEMVSGSLRIASALAPDARLDIESYSANVTLVLPASVSASFRVESFSGNIDNDFGTQAERTSKHGPGKQLEFTVGDDRARVAIETFAGNVRLQRGG